MNDETLFNSESYLRWCHTGVSLSTQAERLREDRHLALMVWIDRKGSQIEVCNNFTTEPFESPGDLKHGDVVVGGILGGATTHWAIRDNAQDAFIELTREGDRVKIISRSSEEWMEKWKPYSPKKVSWTDESMRFKSARAAERARTKVGTYLPVRLGDQGMICESFIRWSFAGSGSSGQAMDGFKFFVQLGLTHILLFGALNYAWYHIIITYVVCSFMNRLSARTMMITKILNCVFFLIHDFWFRGMIAIAFLFIPSLILYLNNLLDRFFGIRSS